MPVLSTSSTTEGDSASGPLPHVPLALRHDSHSDPARILREGKAGRSASMRVRWVVLAVSAIHIWFGVVFVVFGRVPSNLAPVRWYYEMGPAVAWGVVLTASGALACCALWVPKPHVCLWLLAPQEALIVASALAASSRAVDGSHHDVLLLAFPLCLAVAHSCDVAGAARERYALERSLRIAQARLHRPSGRLH